MMSKMDPEPRFEMVDAARKVRTVCIVSNAFEVFGSTKFSAAVADVRDVATGEEFKNIALSTLVPIAPTDPRPTAS